MTIRARVSAARLTYLATAICIFTLGACKLVDDHNTLTLGIISGEAQTAAAGTVLDSLRVIVIDQFGQQTEGIAITWAVSSGGGSVSATSTTTGADGITGIEYTAGASPGSATITATLPGLGTVTFHATIT